MNCLSICLKVLFAFGIILVNIIEAKPIYPKIMETVISADQKIINTLLLNASFINNLGLMHGKMGISILFYHLSRKYKNKIYGDYAGELIDEIYEEITGETPVDFENGLAGIGWGIEYLVQNDFIEADTDEVLEEFDKKIYIALLENHLKMEKDLEGLLGYFAYFSARKKKFPEVTKLFSIDILSLNPIRHQLGNIILEKLRSSLETSIAAISGLYTTNQATAKQLAGIIPDIQNLEANRYNQ